SSASPFLRCTVMVVRSKSFWNWHDAFCTTTIFISNNAPRLSRIENFHFPVHFIHCLAGCRTSLEGASSLPYSLESDGSAHSSESVSAEGAFTRGNCRSPKGTWDADHEKSDADSGCFTSS